MVADERQCATEFFNKSSEYDKICWAITELENRENLKNRVDVRQKVNASLQDRLVKLIGEKPVFNCKLNDIESKVLWDTGSMISLVDVDWVRENTPECELRPISDFLENGEKVEFKAANNTEVPMVGSIVLEFAMGENCFPVPFLVTSTKMSYPILGFNVIEHLISSGKREDVVASLLNSTANITAGKISVMVNLVSQNFGDNDCLGELRTTKPCVIPAKTTVRIRCKVKGDVKGHDMSFMCSAPTRGDWDGSLEVTDSLGELVRGRTPHVNIEVRNNSGHDMYIHKGSVVGEISAVNAVIPVNLFKLEVSGNKIPRRSLRWGVVALKNTNYCT